MELRGGRMMLSLGLLLMVVAELGLVSLISGQQAGVSLRFGGETLTNDSFVDIDDVLNIGTPNIAPTNRDPNSNGAPGAALECITDLENCCGTESDTPSNIMRTVHGDWYLPNGNRVEFSNDGSRFLANRGPNEVINGQQFYGSVRLFKRFSGPPGRGRFRCVLPNAANPSVDQTLYVNILNFGVRFNLPHVTFSSSTGSTPPTAGQRDYSLTCSTILNSDSNLDPEHLPVNVPAPRFVWSFGPSGSDPLPSGVTDMGTTSSDNITFTSTLQFSPLSQSLHAGMYTCRLGPARLVNNITIIVNPPPISAVVIANLNNPLMVGQTGNTLSCGVSGADNLTPMMTYLWTRDGGREVSRSSTLPLSPVGLSDAGNYTCHATVNSDLLTNDIIRSANQIMMVQVPASPSVPVSSSTGSNIILNNSAITVNCEVDFGQGVSESELSLLMVEAQLFRDGTPLTLADPIMRGSSLIFGSAVCFFSDNNVGNYNCTATVRPAPSSQFLIGTGQGTSALVRLTIGIPPTPSRENARCYSGGDIAIAVVVLILIECLLAAPVITAVMVFCWKRNQRKPSQYKSTREVVYEDPDRTAVTTTPGEFKLTECPAYVTTTASSPQTTTEAQLQSGYYEL